MRSSSFVVFAAMFLILMLPTGAAAAPEALYEGVVGEARVVVALTEDGGEFFGRYFYRASRLDIDLSGKAEGGTISLQSRKTGDQLRLKRSGANLTGMLTTVKARSLPVSLQPAGTPHGLAADVPTELSLYERWRLAGLRLAPQQAEAIDGRTIRW